MSKKQKILFSLNVIIAMVLIITLGFGIKNYAQISEGSKPIESKITTNINENKISEDIKDANNSDEKLKEEQKIKEEEKLKQEEKLNEEKKKEEEKLKEEKQSSNEASTSDNLSINKTSKSSEKNVQAPKKSIKKEEYKIEEKAPEQPKLEESKPEEPKKEEIKKEEPKTPVEIKTPDQPKDNSQKTIGENKNSTEANQEVGATK